MYVSFCSEFAALLPLAADYLMKKITSNLKDCMGDYFYVHILVKAIKVVKNSTSSLTPFGQTVSEMT